MLGRHSSSGLIVGSRNDLGLFVFSNSKGDREDSHSTLSRGALCAGLSVLRHRHMTMESAAYPQLHKQME
jgi:hypothetical protein